jgi:3-hydroxyacyl-CoA dehydrogenase
MRISIRKAVVIGSGTMGGGIATLLAGAGVDVTLLDIAAPGTQPGDPPAQRSAIAAEGLRRAAASRPAQLFSAADLERITTGCIEDDLGAAAVADWVIEVVVERIDVKRALMAKLAAIAGPHTIVSTNTSGLPIREIADGLPEAFTRRFLGTHFFNPPRYLRLLEVIPGPNTDPEIVAFMQRYGADVLGKGVVLCQDRPNFIGNRFMTMLGMQTVNAALDGGFTVEEVDALTGPLIGRPRTASFRLNDLIGIDVVVGVARNLYPAIPEDPARAVLEHPGTTALFDRLLQNGWLGNKSGQGFYRTVRAASGEKEFWTLDLATLEYQPPQKVRFDSVSRQRAVADTGERIRRLLAEDDRAAQFLWHHHAFYLAYASHRVPEITDSLASIDNAQKWGFSHELGPFEIWDALGVAETAPAFEAAGYPVAGWVKEMLAAGHTHFYQRDSAGSAVACYSPQAAAYADLPRDPLAIDVRGLRGRTVQRGGAAHPAEVLRNDSASLWDIGQGAALFEIHSPGQALDADVIALGWRALERLEHDFDALVLGSDADRFCVSASPLMLATAAQAGQFDVIERAVADAQAWLQALRTASRPVVIAPHGMALGSGAELVMAGARVLAHAELNLGLVDVGIGLIPASGGCKEVLRRIVGPVMHSSADADPLPHVRRAFEHIMLAKVSESAKQAREAGLLAPCDRIVMSRPQLFGEARREALHLAHGYAPQHVGRVYAAGRAAQEALLAAVERQREAGQASEHDVLIARRLATVLTGGAISQPGWVAEQTILDLEREALLSLLGEEKTVARISHMQQTGKPLRN